MVNSTVLFVDDESSILNSLKRQLRAEKYKCIFANSGAEALEIMKNQKINVIVTDMRMPQMNGFELLKIVQTKYPDVVRVVLSGYTQVPQLIATINRGDIFKFIPKPWTFETEFKPAIEEAINYNKLKLEQKNLYTELEKKNELYLKLLNETKTKIIIFKKEIEKIMNSNTTLIKRIFLETNTEEINEISPKIINIYLEYFNMYLTQLPLKTSSFLLTNLIKDLKESSEKMQGKDKLIFNCEETTDYKVNGDYNFLLSILKQLIKILIIYNKNEDKTLLIKIEKKDEIVITRFITKITLLENENNKKLLLETQLKILSEIFKESSGRVNYLKQDNDIFIEFMIKSELIKD